MVNQITIGPANITYRDEIASLLLAEKLPVEDLPVDLSNFFIASDKGIIIGVIGLEIYGSYGLLRSAVVKPGYRGMKVAAALVNEVELIASKMGLHGVYLLTETAQGYFSKKGYLPIDRNDAPDSIQQSSEFSHVCPSSAILMLKKI